MSITFFFFLTQCVNVVYTVLWYIKLLFTILLYIVIITFVLVLHFQCMLLFSVLFYSLTCGLRGLVNASHTWAPLCIMKQGPVTDLAVRWVFHLADVSASLHCNPFCAYMCIAVICGVSCVFRSSFLSRIMQRIICGGDRALVTECIVPKLLTMHVLSHIHTWIVFTVLLSDVHC